MVNEIVNYSVGFLDVLSQRTSDLLNEPSFMLSRERKQDAIEPWNVKSFVGKLSCKDAPDFPIPKLIKNSRPVSFASSLGRKNFSIVRHKCSDVMQMVNAARQDKYRISLINLFISNLGNERISSLVLDKFVE